MSNNYIITSSVELAAIQTVVNAIRAIDVPAIAADTAAVAVQVTTVDTVVDTIRATDVPAIAADTAAVQADLTAHRAEDMAEIANNSGNYSDGWPNAAVTGALLSSRDAIIVFSHTSYGKEAEILCGAADTLTVEFDYATVGGDTSYFRIKKNDAWLGTEVTSAVTGWQTHSEDLVMVAGDLIQLNAHDTASCVGRFRNFRIIGKT